MEELGKVDEVGFGPEGVADVWCRCGVLVVSSRPLMVARMPQVGVTM